MSLTFEQELFLLAQEKAKVFVSEGYTVDIKIRDAYLKFYQEAEKLKNATH